MRQIHQPSAKDELAAVKLEIERAKLAKLRGTHSADGSHVETFLHYEDLPAPSPEDQDRFYVRLASLVSAFEQSEEGAERHDVNPMTHNPVSGEPYDYSEVEAKYGPYDRPGKQPVTVTLRPRAKGLK